MVAELRRRQFTVGDGVSIVADEGGPPDAPTVLLLHGGGQTRHSWSGAMDALAAAGYHVVSYDARGHGESGWSPDGRYGFHVWARDVAAVAAQLPRPLAVIGASMGGIATLQAMSDGLRPDVVVLVDIVLRPERAGVERVRLFMAGNPNGFANIEEAVDAVANYNPNRPRPANPSGLQRNLRRRDDGRLYWHWDPRLVPPNVDDDLRAMTEIVDGVARIEGIPVLLVRGTNSDVVSANSAAEFQRALPEAEVLEVHAAGHMVVGDRNDQFNAGVLDYLSRHLPIR